MNVNALHYCCALYCRRVAICLWANSQKEKCVVVVLDIGRSEAGFLGRKEGFHLFPGPKIRKSNFFFVCRSSSGIGCQTPSSKKQGFHRRDMPQDEEPFARKVAKSRKNILQLQGAVAEKRRDVYAVGQPSVHSDSTHRHKIVLL